MDSTELKGRTKRFGLRIINLVASLPNGTVGRVLGRQLLRSGTSVGANYREAVRASSRADFRAKIKIVEREADESVYWLELLAEAGIVKSELLAELHNEADELTAIFATTAKSAKKDI